MRSQTGELEWDWGMGQLTINAPAAQGVTGFLSEMGQVDLGSLRIESAMDYGSILVVSLDGQWIANSGRLLLQVASEEQPHEWATSSATGVRTLTNRGTVPLLVKNLAGTVQLKRADAAAMSVVLLDFNGYRLDALPGDASNIALRPDVPYYLIEK